MVVLSAHSSRLRVWERRGLWWYWKRVNFKHIESKLKCAPSRTRDGNLVSGLRVLPLLVQFTCGKQSELNRTCCQSRQRFIFLQSVCDKTNRRARVQFILTSLPSARLNLHDLAYAVSRRGNMALICCFLHVNQTADPLPVAMSVSLCKEEKTKRW